MLQFRGFLHFLSHESLFLAFQFANANDLVLTPKQVYELIHCVQFQSL